MIRILIISDDPAAHTGFGTVIRNLFGPIHRDHHQAVDILAIACYPMARDKKRVVPTVVSEDLHGIKTLEKIVECDGWPDIIFLLGDWWYWQTDLLNSEWRKQNGCLSDVWYYAPYDGVQMSDIARPYYRSPDVLIAMSQFGKTALESYSGRYVEYLPHGYDDRHYQHVQRPKKQQTVFGVVSRNGRRKNIWAIVQAYWDLPTEIDARLILHVGKNDFAGGNLDAWAQLVGEGKRTIEWTDGVQLVKNGVSMTAEGMSMQDMAELYGQIDCLVSAGREGFGLPYLEGRACGCRLILPRYSGHYSMGYPDAIEYTCRHTKPDGGARDVLDIVVDPRAITECMITAHKLNSTVGGPAPMNRPDLRWAVQSETLAKMILAYENKPRQQVEQANLVRVTQRVIRKGHAAIVMPGDFGDVLLCTAVADSLRKRHKHLTFITSERHFPQLQNCPWIDAVEEFNPRLHGDYEVMGEIYEAYYTPYFLTQVAANWVLGGNGRSLAETYAAACNTELGEYWLPTSMPTGLPDRYVTIHTGPGTGRHAGRKYDRWEEVAALINIPTIQIGGAGDICAGASVDLRGKTSATELAGVISRAALHVGIDSFPMHISAVAGVRSVIVWGNTMPTATGPEPRLRHLVKNIEANRACPRACHKLECTKQAPCIQTIPPALIASEVKNAL